MPSLEQVPLPSCLDYFFLQAVALANLIAVARREFSSHPDLDTVFGPSFSAMLNADYDFGGMVDRCRGWW